MYTKLLSLLLISSLFTFSGCKDPFEKTTENQNQTTTTSDTSTSYAKSKTPVNTANLKQINVLVVVDSNDGGTKSGATQTKIDHFMSVTNQVLQNSTVPAKVNVVKVQPFAFGQQDSKSALSTIYHNSKIASIRNSVNADLVVIYRNNANDGLCGIAYLNQALNSNIAYAHVSLNCPSTTTAHEIGHTMGLQHSSKKTARNGHTSYGRGYGVNGEFATIMAYRSTYNTGLRVFNYSSPSIECQGYTCGVPNAADSVTALKNSIATVASFR